jgi:xylan 1,4-beta-xylosidase
MKNPDRLKDYREFRYTNPITRDPDLAMRDHCIQKVGDRWYCTGTSHPIWTGRNPGVRLLVSDDLISWTHHSWLIDASALPEDCPYNGRFRAPEIHFIKNRFYFTINSGRVTEKDPKGMDTHSIWLFSSPEITGPYAIVNGPLTRQYNNDATLFEDDDGRTYLYCSGNGLFQAEIDLDSGKLMRSSRVRMDNYGHPAIICCASSSRNSGLTCRNWALNR